MIIFGKKYKARERKSKVIPIAMIEGSYLCYIIEQTSPNDGHTGYLSRQEYEIVNKSAKKYNIDLDKAIRGNKFWYYEESSLEKAFGTIKKTNRRVKDENIKHTSLWA